MYHLHGTMKFAREGALTDTRQVGIYVLLKEGWKTTLLQEIGEELDMSGEHQYRQVWSGLLSSL